MGKLVMLAFFILFNACANREPPARNTQIFHSVATNDDYTIAIRKPEGYQNNKQYHVVYVADGSIGLGQYVMGTDTTWKAKIPADCIVVTIGHIGNWELKRRRDFIPSDAGGYQDNDFGHADHFYSFLKNELVPFIDKKFQKQKSKYFIGHSFSGLFSLYAALKNEKLFDVYFAISPSVWANDLELLKLEEAFAKTNKDFSATIHLYVGGLEIFNKVLSSTKTFYNQVRNRNYKQMNISMDVIRSANHFSVRKPAIDKIFTMISK